MSMSSSATHTPAMNPGGFELKWIVSEWRALLGRHLEVEGLERERLAAVELLEDRRGSRARVAIALMFVADLPASMMRWDV